MTEYRDQLQRIRNKLPLAKAADPKLEVFGASSHKYEIDPPATLREVTSFEAKYGIELPACYRSFILEVGNGGISYEHSAAGPFYGIYQLGKNVDVLWYENPELHLKNDCVIYPGMTDEYWKGLIATMETDDVSDDVFEAEISRVFGGILPIGSQGCTYLHGIVLTGPHKGKVVNLDIDRQKPQFAFENNFLDWYERWLDEVISGDLLQGGPSWFGYYMGGFEQILIQTFQRAGAEQQKIECLEGILRKKKVDRTTIQIIEDELLANTGTVKTKLLEILAKFDFAKATPYLLELRGADLLSVFEFVYWYAKDKSGEWYSFICEHISSIKDDEIFRFCTYVLEKSGMDYGHLIVPFIQNDNEGIRSTAIYTLGKLSNKKNYLNSFILGLNDSSNRVIHTSLQALDGIVDVKLLEHYRRIAERFSVEQDYILVNLNHRLRDYGLDNKSILEKETFSNLDKILMRIKSLGKRM